MKTYKYFSGVLAIALYISISGCHNLFNDDDREPELKHLVNYEVLRSYIPFMVESMLDQLVTTNPEMAEIRERVNYGLVVYKITYKTTFNDKSIIASGLVSAPMGQGPFPIISYQNGTNTLHSNAPSVNPDRDFYRLLEAVASTGFVVSMPDYLGFGLTNNMFHPYLHKNSTVPVVIDMLKAVEELGTLRGFTLNKDLYLTGYSMGGWATLQVQKEIETSNSSGFNLKASAPSAGPYYLNTINEYVLSQKTYPMPYFIGFVYDSYKNLEEISTPLEEVFNSPYDSLIAVVYNGKLSGEEINSQLTTNVSELFTRNYLENRDTGSVFSSIALALEANSVEPWHISTPTRLVHSTDDELVPFQISQKIYQEFLNKGTSPGTISLVPIPEYSHTNGIVPAGIFSIQWFFEISDK